MESWFDNDAHFDALQKELERWRGTPYKQYGTRPETGTDCVQFVRAVLQNVGAINQVKVPERYVIRAGGKQMLEMIEGVIASVPNIARVDPIEIPRRGDILLFARTAINHLAIVANPPIIWHCMNRVEQGNFFDPVVKKHLHSQYRIMP